MKRKIGAGAKSFEERWICFWVASGEEGFRRRVVGKGGPERLMRDCPSRSM